MFLSTWYSLSHKVVVIGGGDGVVVLVVLVLVLVLVLVDIVADVSAFCFVVLFAAGENL